LCDVDDQGDGFNLIVERSTDWIILKKGWTIDDREGEAIRTVSVASAKRPISFFFWGVGNFI
jgi:hypothetical protein